MFDNDEHEDATTFEPNPWGARQRIAPRRSFKAAVSRIVTIVPDLVRQMPPPIPRRVPAGTPSAPLPTARAAAGTPPAPVPTVDVAAPRAARSTPLPPPTPTVSALASASLAFAPPHHAYAVPSLTSAVRPLRPSQTWPYKRTSPLMTKRILAMASGAALALVIGVIIALAMRPDARAQARAQIGANLARGTIASDPIVVPMIATPIEPPAPTVTPTITEPAKPIVKKPRAKKPLQIIAGDPSTPLGDLRP